MLFSDSFDIVVSALLFYHERESHFSWNFLIKVNQEKGKIIYASEGSLDVISSV